MTQLVLTLSAAAGTCWGAAIYTCRITAPLTLWTPTNMHHAERPIRRGGLGKQAHRAPSAKTNMAHVALRCCKMFGRMFIRSGGWLTNTHTHTHPAMLGSSFERHTYTRHATGSRRFEEALMPPRRFTTNLHCDFFLLSGHATFSELRFRHSRFQLRSDSNTRPRHRHPKIYIPVCIFKL